MAWVRMRGIEGLVWEPEQDPVAERKHNCRDCYSCQMCSDARCGECLKRRAHLGRTCPKAKRKK